MLNGRIDGRKSNDGQSYEIRQGNIVLTTIPIAEAVTSRKLAAAIRLNRWEPL